MGQMQWTWERQTALCYQKSWHRSAFSKENQKLHVAVCGIFPFLDFEQGSLTESYYFPSIF